METPNNLNQMQHLKELSENITKHMEKFNQLLAVPNELLEHNSILGNMEKFYQPLVVPNELLEHNSVLGNMEKFYQALVVPNELLKHNSVLENLEKINQAFAVPNELLEHNSVLENLEKINQAFTIPNEFLKHNSVIEKFQKSAQLYERFYETDIISSFTSKLKTTEYYDEDLIKQVEETKPIIDYLKIFPKEFKEQLMAEVQSYINEQVNAKIEEKIQDAISNSTISSDTTSKIDTVFSNAMRSISEALTALYGFYELCPVSMKDDVYLICFVLLMSLFALPTIYFLYKYHEENHS